MGQEATDVEPEVIQDRGDELLPPDIEAGSTDAEVDEVLNGKAEEDEAAPNETTETDESADEEPAAAKTAAATDDRPRKGKQSANERIQELISRNKTREAEYQARIKELETTQAKLKVAEDLTEAEGKLAEMEEQYAQLLLDGSAKDAARIRQEMRQLERAIYSQQSAQASLQAKEAAKEEIRYDSTVSTLELVYPEINPDAEEYDVEAVDEVLALHRGLVNQGLPPSMAVQRAVKYVFGERTKATADAPQEEKGLQRIKDTKSRNVEAAKKQPASTAKVGADSDKLGGGVNEASILKMNYDEFSQLSEDALAKMRGDYV
jgi:hypothetical protein